MWIDIYHYDFEGDNNEGQPDVIEGSHYHEEGKDG
jgi:hypothetical protein